MITCNFPEEQFVKPGDKLPMPKIADQILWFDITENDDFMISDRSPKLPVDRNGHTIMVDDILILHHNKHVIKVQSMIYKPEFKCWLIFGYNSDGWSSHGGFSLPESQDNVERVMEQDLVWLRKAGYKKHI